MYTPPIPDATSAAAPARRPFATLTFLAAAAMGGCAGAPDALDADTLAIVGGTNEIPADHPAFTSTVALTLGSSHVSVELVVNGLSFNMSSCDITGDPLAPEATGQKTSYTCGLAAERPPPRPTIIDSPRTASSGGDALGLRRASPRSAIQVRPLRIASRASRRRSMPRTTRSAGTAVVQMRAHVS